MLTQPVADLHTHTVYSMHAYSTVTENAAAAARKGLLAIGMTDHAPAVPEPGHHWHFTNMRVLPTHIAGVRVLRGVEANVLDFDGTLDVNEKILANLDMVIASMHMGIMKPGSVADITRAWLAIAADPRVDIIGHPGTPAFAFDEEPVIRAFAAHNKIVEINEGSFAARGGSLPNCTRIAYLCKKYGVRIVVSSDAHFHEQVGNFASSMVMLEQLEFPPELIVNGSRETLEAFLKSKNLTL